MFWPSVSFKTRLWCKCFTACFTLWLVAQVDFSGVIIEIFLEKYNFSHASHWYMIPSWTFLCSIQAALLEKDFPHSSQTFKSMLCWCFLAQCSSNLVWCRNDFLHSPQWNPPVFKQSFIWSEIYLLFTSFLQLLQGIVWLTFSFK